MAPATDSDLVHSEALLPQKLVLLHDMRVLVAQMHRGRNVYHKQRVRVLLDWKVLSLNGHHHRMFDYLRIFVAVDPKYLVENRMRCVDL